MKKYKPTSSSRRNYTVVDFKALSKVKAAKSLTQRLKTNAGRNNQGRITTRHQGGGVKKLYRVIDFKMKPNIPAKVETIEYDPYRTAFVAKIVYKDGARAYIVAPDKLKVGQIIQVGESVHLEIGNRTLLKRILEGTFIHNVEIVPGKGGQLGRSAGSSLQVLANEEGYTHVKMPSGEVRKIPWDGYASIGQVSNVEHNLTILGKAGRSRWLGIRPTVRGKVMNPREHPYGGGEGRTQRGTKRPKTKWGKITGGRKTRRKKKKSNTFILARRNQKK